MAACAMPIPSDVPTIPYGKSDNTGVGETDNTRYYLDTPEGYVLIPCSQALSSITLLNL